MADRPMTPLSEHEKKAIAKTFRWLKSAIDHRNDIGAIHARLDDFTRVYRGGSLRLIEQFSIADNQHQWLTQLQARLVEEVGPEILLPLDLDRDI